MVVTNRRKSNLKKAIKMACVGLVGATCIQATAEDKATPVEENAKPSIIEKVVKNKKSWFFKSAILYYTESDRVTAVEPVFEAKKVIDEGEELKIKLVLDSLTGASHNGAAAATTAQTFTTPSGHSTYTAAPNETPLDDTFHDTRVALSSSYTKPVNEKQSHTYGVNVSNEYDYFSTSLNFMLQRFFNNKNTSLNLGLSYAHDSIDPEGGVPIALAQMQAPASPQPKTNDPETKDTIDFITGVTQIIDSKSLFQLNYSYSKASGYMNDPFKVVSVVDPITGAPNRYVYESRPDSREKHALYGEYKKFWKGDVINASYRFMLDDWGIESHTLDFRYFFILNDKDDFIRPSIRIYQQSEADFFAHSYTTSNLPSKHASADYRLGKMLNYSLGLKYKKHTSQYNAWAVKLEYYLQTNDDVPGSGIGQQRSVDLSPDVDAYILQISYDF